MLLPSTILFDYPSVEALCAYILACQVGGEGWLVFYAPVLAAAD